MSDAVSQLQAAYERLKLLYQVSNVIHSTLDPQQALQLILQEAVRLMRASSGSVVLINPNNGLLEIQASTGLPPDASELKLRVGQGITGWVARTGKPARGGRRAAGSALHHVARRCSLGIGRAVGSPGHDPRRAQCGFPRRKCLQRSGPGIVGGTGGAGGQGHSQHLALRTIALKSQAPGNPRQRQPNHQLRPQCQRGPAKSSRARPAR